MTTKRRFRLGSKVLLLIGFMILAVVGGAAAVSYSVYSTKIDAIYMEEATQIASTAVYFSDGDFSKRLYDAVNTEEFAALREKAIAENNATLIEGWLKDNGFYEDYVNGTTRLYNILNEMGVSELYTQVQDGNISVNLLDPNENLLYLGSIEISPEEFENSTTNEHVDPTVNYTDEYGWLCSAYEPVYDSAGNAVATVGVDIDMNDIMAERYTFLKTLLAYAVLLAVCAGFLGSFLMRIIVVRPLETLAVKTKGFTSNENGYDSDCIIENTRKSNDEIYDLYEEIRSMEVHIVDYITHIEEITAEKNRIGAELNVATQIQADMLPRIFPPFPERTEFDLYASMNPAKEVGGDFYDFFLVDDDHLALVMADVSGKGVPAALFMVIAKTLIKNRAQMGGFPSETLAYANEQLCEGNDAELFVTVWMAILEISTGKCVIANAGHEHPVVRRADGEFELVVYRHSPAVATIEGIRFKEHEFMLYPGDSLFVYTDGVAEATNASDELYGTDRLLAALNKDPDASPKEILDNVKASIDEFVGDAPQFDDITMLDFIYYGKGGQPDA